ncbi:RNA polymerase sigma factor [Kutzneria buriramensis]|uniref:RNA polymerase sigma-70 factor (ECF subfamily) n=1 Tax=Kutzneria buriramensis TaxID=1045776 RepID=A0A3E0GSZ6_9PSEU|nr:sigma-70 family RNA polymerase sigma factor [Kutzneria buriramensis]REH26192.1 RNA polymerase sigma-70 factor (ECF subfamily) [Kutzneria buriramensis]
MALETDAEFSAMYRAHYADVLAFVRRRAHPGQADDVVGETFLTAWRRRRDLPDDPRPWLFRTARNLMLNASRSAHRQRAVALRVAEQGRDDAYQPMLSAEARLDLLAAWRGLSTSDQEILALHVWEGLTDKEAATVLGCSRAAYSMRLSRAKRRLAKRAGPGVELSTALVPANVNGAS